MSEDDDVEYHETQKARDCSVHSLNNAVGRRAITPEEVVSEIKRRVSAFRDEAERLGFSKADAAAYRRSLADGKTYFTAEAVWVAALALGRIGAMPQNIEGAIEDAKTLEPAHFLVDRVHAGGAALIILGKTNDDTYHAVAVREGKIRDSLKDGDDLLDFSQEALKATYKEIFGVYAI